MSLSLIGIIFVQGYWISSSVDAKREQFSFNARQSLAATIDQIENRELEDYYYPIQKLADSIGMSDDISFDEYFFINEDLVNNELTLYKNGILQEDFKLTAPGYVSEQGDSIQFKRYTQRKTTQILKKNAIDGNQESTSNRIQEFSRLIDFEKKRFAEIAYEITKDIPIHKRLTSEEIRRILTIELVERNVETDFDFGVYSNGLLTKVHSENFKYSKDAPSYVEQLFSYDKDVSDYTLYVQFPGEKRFVISSIIGMAVLSIIFTLIIVIAYSSALHQLNKQRQISEIKTDFINNMTHEFKTPIATINLALDALKNPKISSFPEKVSYYHGLIREENKRMHAQVENVLRISKLEKNELDIQKERLDMNELVEDAINHISLIVEDRNGYVNMHLNADRTSVLANESHFTNVLVNILDNAVKYTSEERSLGIDVYTENVKDLIIVKISDKGDGMSKAVQKKVFEKFYREHTGDIHNVKGHGLGLAYAKRIVDDHQGEIYVESELGKGSTFIIKLPLIS
ncbi:sensor histidine kinase [Dokdonia sp. Hel_I_53]|uniref:sensor histidine kinase n=1 Tax=Dokdonia sp. Hel_I_53 TaxID=1566287 RepID=UPI00119C84A9|nr:HAMP domain-containing sensor histidine kinase [Dokdonia sp. Hel_I_53]TVZ53275.1 two-component system phosphate regulon sensor histidine kinase PhoR [Dokdonia sp. Hel_I_53]